jgi:hypothetical protein
LSTEGVMSCGAEYMAVAARIRGRNPQLDPQVRPLISVSNKLVCFQS